MKYLLIILFAFLSFTVEAQQTDVVDFISIKADLGFKPEEKQVFFEAEYKFQVFKEIDSVYIDARNTYHYEVKYKNFKGHISNFKDEQIVFHAYKDKPFEVGKIYEVNITFFSYPKKAIYFVEIEDSHQIWTQGQGKYTSNWLPSIDDMNDKIEFDLSITYDSDYTVIANGKLADKQINESTTTWHYDMQKPMSSYLVALAIGKYNKKEIKSKSGISIQLYYYPEDSAKVEPTYRYTKQMFDFLEDEIGVPYPWQNYKQVPVKDFLYSGMENTSCTIFSDDFVIDETSFIDKNYVNVNAHELAHQWFGNLVTETSGTHHWLQEGFATYYALLAERDIFGDDYYYNTLYEYAKELIIQEQAGDATTLLDPKASSVTFYKKGAWALHVLKEKVGEQAFKEAVRQYLNNHAFKNVKTEDFISEVEKTSGKDLSRFETEWLNSKTLPLAKMRASLKKNESINFIETIEYKTDYNGYESSSLVTALPKGYYTQRLAVLREALRKPEYPTYKGLIKDAFSSNEIKTRQLLANYLPDGFKEENESLLQDASYITKEIALYNLWSKYPKDKAQYLDATKGVIGFNDKNVRCLWLTLALLTPDYDVAFNKVYLRELRDYTSSKYGFQTRQNAFSYVNKIQAFDYQTLANLIEATNHHNWRFKSFAKELLQSLLKNEKYKDIITNLQNN